MEAYGAASGALSVTGKTGTVQKWQSKVGTDSWTDIANTTSSLNYSNVTTTTNYKVIVKNGACAEANSDPATITIYAIPTLSIVGSDAISPGESTQVVTDAGLFSYQWYRDGEPIDSATANSLIVTKPGAYKVSVKATNTSPTYTTAELSIGSLALDEQPTPVNYIVSTLFLKEGVSEQTDLFDLERQDYSQVIQYFDGLGRPMQNVTRQSSPSGNDIVQPIVYDDFGREYRKYLPFVADETTGWYKADVINSSTGAYQNAALDFYNDNTDAIADDGTPWAETSFEPSPLNRVLKQGAPGTTWQPDLVSYENSTDHSIKYQYKVNNAGEVLRWSYTPGSETYPLGTVNAGTNAAPTKYSAHELLKVSTKDEDLHETITYTDKQDHVILKKAQAPGGQWAETYYIYDDNGRLVTVIPPEAVNRLASEYNDATPANRELFLQQWAFRYRYDKRSRLIIKQIPGADSVSMVYDNRDRLVLTQDGNQRTTTGEWTFTKYDALDRPVLTGKYINTNNRKVVQASVDSYYANLTGSEAWFETYKGATGTVLGYTNNSFPSAATESDYYTATYYDKYDTYIAPTGYTYLNESLPEQESAACQRVRGSLTGAKVKNLSSGAWMRTVNYYDDKLRIIQSIADHQKGTVRTSNVYDFVKMLISKRTYVVNSATKTIKETYTYDPAGRLISINHSIDGGSDVTIVKNEYNEIGQLIDKRLHSTDGNTFLQSVDYRYNIRGWLTQINDADVGSIADGDNSYDYFGMELLYDSTVSGLSNTGVFNGDISAIQWSKGDGGSVGKQAYTFLYDPLNRLTEADHFDKGPTDWISNRSYQERVFKYDLNGNIEKLSRRGFEGMLIDSLEYSYLGAANQLQYVHDYGDPSEGFINGNTATDDYSYDYNGNLDKDGNKGLTSKGNIKYNYLNLPCEIDSVTKSIKYIYDATGRKLAQEQYSNNGSVLVKRTDYIGELVYEGDNLQFIQHPEGRVLPDGAGWEYQYHLKDHLGNVRVTFTAKPQTPDIQSANLETGTPNSGEGSFGNYYSSTFDLVDHTDAGTTYQKVQWITSNARIGLTKSFSVMPGDRVSVTAYAKYMNLSTNGNLTAFAAALTAAFGVSSSSVGEQLKLYNGLNGYGLSVPQGDHPNDDDTAPKAFVTILLFDRNYNLLDAAWDQVTTDLEQVSGTEKEPFAYPLTKEVTVQEAGYAYIFLSNEHPYDVDVYFDDVTVAHTPSPIVASSDYYPFGLSYNAGQREGGTEQQFLYNGKELQDELSINWYDYGARMYMPEIGRWGVIDPLAEGNRRWSPYRYGFDNPMRFIDPDGMFEYSNGYSTQDSRNETGSVSYSGVYGDEATTTKDMSMANAAAPDVTKQPAHIDQMTPTDITLSPASESEEKAVAEGPGDPNPVSFFIDMMKAWLNQFTADNKEDLYVGSGQTQNKLRQVNTVVNTLSKTQVTPYLSVSFGRYGGTLSDNYTLTWTPNSLYLTAGMDFTLDSSGGLPNIGGSMGFMTGPESSIIGPGWGATGGAFFMGVESGGALDYQPNIAIGRPSSFGFAVSTSKYWVGISGGYTYPIYTFK